ncbi:MAG TPA: ATP-binding protein [Solirubrobacterales bacterium]|nr:ATP-binding protein [Solirubrobacterales bacterium]
MPVELAEVAAGLPIAASLAVVGGITTLREGRRRIALNEAMHELRRPLQVLSLSLPADPPRAGQLESSLQMADAALERLDREINGGPVTGVSTAVPLRPLLEVAVRRWRTRAVLGGGTLRLHCRAGEPFVEGDRFLLAQAVDNLISNAIEHGGGEVTIDAREIGDRLRLAVIDSGSAPSAPSRRSRVDLRARVSGRRRHGHGLRVVARAAAAHGGSFDLRRSDEGAEALLDLPLHRAGLRRGRREGNR